MAVAYFDCSSGVAGDMILGALVDLGMPLSHLKEKLKLLPLPPYSIGKVRGADGLKGTNIRVDVGAGDELDARKSGYRSIDRMISGSRLSKGIRDLARDIFERLARAEAKVHGVPIGRVHFHEVGAVDSIVDIVGAAIGFEYFGFDSIYSSPIPMTRGTVECAHGAFPVPAPATVELLKGIPLEPTDIEGEIVTPTGAAILASVSKGFGECPLQTIRKVGYGFGDRRIPRIPNALRLMVGDGFPTIVVQTNFDDINPQIFDHVIEKLFAAGAVDVDLQAIQMKKNRPGVRLTALSPWSRKEDVIDTIFKETTTFGVKYWPVDRRILLRRLVERKTKYGRVAFKIGYDPDGNAMKAIPEYEDVKRLARKKGLPLIDVYREMCSAGLEILRRRR